MSRRRHLCLALLLLTRLALASPTHASEQSLSLSAAMSSVYNNNFLEYSDNQLTTFQAGTHPLRFAVQSTDDAIFSPGLSLTWDLDQGGGRRHALRAHGDGDFHGTNSGADRRSYSGRWTESFSGGRRLALGYSRLDHYYVRQLRDEDLFVLLPATATTTQKDATWQRAEFDQAAVSASWREPLGKRANLGLAYRYEKRDYVPAFRERSARANQGEVSVGWNDLPHHGELELSGGYRQSKAEATDGDAIVGDDDDVSFHGRLAGVTGRVEFTRSRALRWRGDLGVDVASRAYDSKRPPAVDPFHVGRNDMLLGFEAGLRAAWHRWDARAFLRIENNTANLGTGASPTSDSGSYHEHQFGLELSWSGAIWKSRTKPE